MNARMIVLACLLATVGVSARSAAVVLAPTTVDVHTLEFEPTQNARPGSSGVMTIKILDGGTTVFFALRGGYPNTVRITAGGQPGRSPRASGQALHGRHGA